jgi:amidohydrolase
MLLAEIKEIAKKIQAHVIADRRHLHAHPELSFKEFETSAFIKKRLTEIGIPFESVHGTGIVALLRGDRPSENVIALRADMDALPITETKTNSYVSLNQGVMHACGHDAHSASLLGTAEILHELKSKFCGTVKFIFQPAEEKLPGGAIGMIREGVLDNPKPISMIGQHVMPSMACGAVGIHKGKFMASMDELFVTIHGKGGHGAEPHKTVDPVVIASHIILALQQIVSRNIDPLVPAVLSFGKVIADGAINIIPDKVYMEGTFRTFDEDWRNEAHEKMKKIACGIAESMGGSCDFSINRGYPHLINNDKLTDQVSVYITEYLGADKLIHIDPWMAAEDFSYYSHVIDTCFYLLGTGNEKKGIASSLHTPGFDIDEDALLQGTGLMAYIAVRQLEDIY